MNDPLPPPSEIARHTVRGSVYSVTASAITIGLGLLRTYLMVTLLLPEQVGLAALGLFYVEMSTQFGSLGLNTAFIHKPDAGPADRRTYYTFHFLLGAGVLGAVSLAAPAIAGFYPQFDGLQVVIWLYAGITLLSVANQPQVAFLEKDLRFNRIAVLDVCGAVATTVVGPGLAFLGFGVWAILGEFAAGVLARFALLHFWIRPFRPQLGWDRASAGWFWRYGRSVWMNSNLTFLLGYFDDFWVGTGLGRGPLGIYNKAYEFSRYPRRVVANPVLSVFFPTFAYLQGDRTRLSRAFFRAASLIVRLGGLFALVAVIAAPEVFRLFLPEAWLPMRPVFQWMLAYTFFDPLQLAARRLLLATGRPGEVVRTGWFQLAVFVPAVVIGARGYGVEGVAVAADLMVLVGVFLLFRAASRVVDYSPSALWLWPVVAVVGITVLAVLAAPAMRGLADPWSLALKLTAVPALYAGFLYLVERDQLLTGVRMIRGLLGRTPSGGVEQA